MAMTTEINPDDYPTPAAYALAVYESLEGFRPDPLAAIETTRWLPDWIWTTSPRLEHVRVAARARRVGPDAVLAVVLARVAAWSNPDIRLPPIVGDDASTSILVDLFGPPSSGKSSSVATGRRLIPRPDHIPALLDGFPIGSGEGISEAFYGEVVNDETGKRERGIVNRNLFAYADEGEILSALANRNGSTLMTTLRTVFTAGTLGQGNAAVEKRRIVPANTYAIGVVLATQEAKAVDLFADVSGGTPQRFLCVMSTDPDAPDVAPKWPGAIDWNPPQGSGRSAYVDGRLVHYYAIADPIVDLVDTRRLVDLRGLQESDHWTAHTNLKRLKVAALLASLDGSLAVTEERWNVAGSIVATSDRVVGHARHVIARDQIQRDNQTNDRHARRAIHVESQTVGARTERGAVWIGRRVHKVGPINQNDVRRSASTPTRDVFPEAVDLATSREWIAVETRTTNSNNGRDSIWLVPGSKRP